MTYFHENVEETFGEFWRNSLKITEEIDKVARNLKNENRNQKILLACTHSLIGNWWKKQKIIIKKIEEIDYDW